MKQDLKFIFAADVAQEIPADPVLAFFSDHYEGIWHSARLLGGYESARLVDRCAELLTQNQRVTNQARVMLDQILSVLSLDRVADPDLPYMGHFAIIDPLDPVVEEICLLTDGLRHVLSLRDAPVDLRRVA